MKKKTIYVYQDRDHGDIEVFDTLKKALAYFTKMWDHDPEWEVNKDGSMHDMVSDYVIIHKKELK